MRSEAVKDLDSELMLRAIELGAGGDPTPNPHVGSVLTKTDGTIIAEGFHEAAGLDHAEVVALKQAGPLAHGSTLYVTLEPCNHHGRTPPCVDAVLAAGVTRVVIGCLDPNPFVPGGGATRLAKAGVVVDFGPWQHDASVLIAEWAARLRERALR